MMLQELLSHAMEHQWFPLSYRGPLQSYVRKYAAALSHGAKTCPPQVYHQPDAVVSEKIFDAAEADLQPRSVQACVNAILKLLHKAVAEGCLSPLKDATISWKQKGHTRQIRIPVHRFRDQDGHDLHLPKYGLTDWPLHLAEETCDYLQWCQAPIMRGRKEKIRKGASSSYQVELTVGQVAGYAVNVQGDDKASLTLRALCEPALLEDFAWWWIERRQRSTETIFNKLAIMKTIARYWIESEEMALAIVNVMRRLGEEAPAQGESDKKRERWLSLDELDRIARSCHPFNERHLKESPEARMVWRHIYEGRPLPPSRLVSKPTSATGGIMRLNYYATWAELELILRLLIHRPLRIMNICNMRFKNLQAQPGGGYEIVFTKGELKNGKYLLEKEWRERFPTRLLPLLNEWLEIWRPRVLHPDRRDAEYVFLNTSGHRYIKETLGAVINRATWRFTQDRLGGPIAWYPHLIRSTWPSEMLNAGLNALTIRRILGDSFKILEKHYGSYERQPPSPFALQLAKEIELRID